MTLVRDLVANRELFHVEDGQTVADVARRMAELQVGAILVLSGGELRGVFSERDLMRRVVLERRDAEQTIIRDVMSTGLATIEESSSIEEAAAKMESQGCRHLPVMRGARVVGFLSMRDLMRHEAARKTEELSHMRDYIRGSG